MHLRKMHDGDIPPETKASTANGLANFDAASNRSFGFIDSALLTRLYWLGELVRSCIEVTVSSLPFCHSTASCKFVT